VDGYPLENTPRESYLRFGNSREQRKEIQVLFLDPFTFSSYLHQVQNLGIARQVQRRFPLSSYSTFFALPKPVA
jgi:hypothetical protein